MNEIYKLYTCPEFHADHQENDANICQFFFKLQKSANCSKFEFYRFLEMSIKLKC